MRDIPFSVVRGFYTNNKNKFVADSHCDHPFQTLSGKGYLCDLTDRKVGDGTLYDEEIDMLVFKKQGKVPCVKEEKKPPSLQTVTKPRTKWRPTHGRKGPRSNPAKR